MVVKRATEDPKDKKESKALEAILARQGLKVYYYFLSILLEWNACDSNGLE